MGRKRFLLLLDTRIWTLQNVLTLQAGARRGSRTPPGSKLPQRRTRGGRASETDTHRAESRFPDAGSALLPLPAFKQEVLLERTRGLDGNEAELFNSLRAHRNWTDLPWDRLVPQKIGII